MAVLWQLGVQFIQGYFVNAPEEVVMAEGRPADDEIGAGIGIAALRARCDRCVASPPSRRPRRAQTRRRRASNATSSTACIRASRCCSTCIARRNRMASASCSSAGSGWQADPDYGATPLKETQIDLWGPPLTAAGYTVFAINHRGAPRFHYPAAIEDVQRAIRFVRANAARYGIDGAQLGGLGGSSGGNLIGLAAMRAAPGIRATTGCRESRIRRRCRPSCCARPSRDLRELTDCGRRLSWCRYMEVATGERREQSLYDAASPVAQVRAGAPPTLLIHGDADDLIPIRNRWPCRPRCAAANVRCDSSPCRAANTARISAPAASRRPTGRTTIAETVAWFDQHLRRH